ncbi:MAG: ferredoxin-NADP reductase [Myxococcota bacterium]|nr:ferredoxin-NADP reductase [Myxococcota bacterium]
MSDAIHHVEDYDRGPRYEATVVSSERITAEAAEEEVRELVLDVDRDDFPFRVGQSIGVLAPGSPEFGHDRHVRLYSVADLPERGAAGRPRIKIAVRRCSYVDEYSGERYPGIASNFLCDRAPGDRFSITGPFGLAFEVPEERDAHLILIGSGTGIAPFRAFVKHLYAEVPDWRGTVWLFYGARSGLELLYMNEERDDFAQYYDRDTFEAFRALSARPSWTDSIAWDDALESRGEELWQRLGEPKTYVYVAGLEKMLAELDKVFVRLAGSAEKWERRKAELMAGRRWVELVY